MAITIDALNGNKIAVRSPFCRVFVSRARDIGGRWQADLRAWLFPAEAVEPVQLRGREVV